MKRNGKEIMIRVVILLIGLTIAHLGVTLFLLADLGADPFNVMVQGIFRTVDRLVNWSFLTHGNTHMTICFLIILILLIADRNYIKIGTILCMICGGPIIDFFTGLLSCFFENEMELWVKIIVLAAGCVILAFGMTVVIKSDAGTGPNDLVAVVISDKTKRKFSIVRIIVDVSFVLVGFLLGGSVGIGTIICAALVGPVAGFFMPFNEKIVHNVLKMCGFQK
ncbi:MAG: YitT family protein [Oliverpabstia sp.]